MKKSIIELGKEHDNKEEIKFFLTYINNDTIPEIGVKRYSFGGILYFEGDNVKRFFCETGNDSIYFIPNGSLVSRVFRHREEYSCEIYSFPDFKEKSESDYEKAKAKYGELTGWSDSVEANLISYTEILTYLGFPEEAYEVYTTDDLDGDGKKEKKGITGIYEYDSLYGREQKKTAIYINNKIKYNATYDWSEEGPISIEITDINPSDKFKELVVKSYDGHGIEENTVFRYKNKKLKYLFCEVAFKTNDKPDDTVTLFAYSSSRLGVLGIWKDYKITKNGLKELRKKGTFDVCGDQQYTASEDIKIYKNSDKKKIVKTIKAGEVFRVTKLMYKYNKESKYYTCQYAYVDTKDRNNAGWIYVEGNATPWEGNFMVDNYMWYD